MQEDGMSMIEVIVAIMVMSVGVLGVIGGLGSSLSLVGNSRQRSAAVSVAVEQLEAVHTIPYDRIALSTQPVHSVSSDPDSAVSTDGSSYSVDGSTSEPLIVDPVNGALKHIDDPVRLNNTVLNIYRYVTWHDDPNVTGTADYKRVVVVVTWKVPLHRGPTNTVVQSTFIGPNGFVVPRTTPGPTSSPGATPTPIPTTTPTPTSSGTCTGAPPAGSMTVSSGAGAVQGYTNSTNAQVTLNATASCAPITAKFSNTPGAACSSFTNVATLTSGTPSTVTWTIPAGDGSKTISVCFVDAMGNASPVYTGAVVLDQHPPSPAPANLRKSFCDANVGQGSRTVTLTWDTSQDPNLVGYRVYKNVKNAGFTQLLTTANSNFTDTDSKSYSSLIYRVTAYDKAGNESGPANDYAFSSNSC